MQINSFYTNFDPQFTLSVMETQQQQKTSQKASFGNRSSVSDAAVAYPSRTIVHAKLEMTEPGDHDEQEADAAANDIVNGGKIRRKISGNGGGGTAVSPQVESQIAQLQGGGHAMPAGLRNMMENGFGRDFSQVRLHTDSQAADMSSSISARAFTHGNDIYFNRGQFSPNTSEGQRLVAHELTHVAQGTGKVGRLPIDPPIGWFEMQARRIEKDDKIKKEKLVKLQMAESKMAEFVSEQSWIKDKVIGEELYEKLALNYLIEDHEQKKPVVIVVFTSHSAACHGEIKPDKACAFEEVQTRLFWNSVQGSISSLLESSINERVLMIQAPTNNADLKTKIQEISRNYGPIKDVVFRGHGNSSVIDVNYDIESSSISNGSNDLFLTIAEEMYKDTSIPHSIILGGCLTDSDARSNIGLSAVVRDQLKKRNYTDINIQGNESSVNTKDQSLAFDDERNLILGNEKDPTAPKSNEELSDYRGCECQGVLRNMIGKLDPKTQEQYSKRDDFIYCDYYFSDSLKNITIEKTRNNKKEIIIIPTRDLIKLVQDRDDYRGKKLVNILPFLQRIDKEDNQLFNEALRIRNSKQEVDVYNLYRSLYRI